MLVAQGQGLQVALKGGACSWQSSQPLSTLSPEVGLDLNYIVRWRMTHYTQLGLHTGVGATYSVYNFKGDYSSQFTRQDYLGNTIHYTTTAHAQEQHQAIGISAPVLFAMQTHGFAINIGPRLLWMAYDSYQQTIDQARIEAYYPAYKVRVVDQPSTGMLTTPYHQSGHNPQTSISLLVTAEIGYEWQLGNPYHRFKEQYIGIQLYANYDVWSWNKNGSEPFLSVGAITQGVNPKISTTSIQSAASLLKYMSLGVRLYYTIQTVDYPGRGWHHYRPCHRLVKN